jgi:hypothetical protein
MLHMHSPFISIPPTLARINGWDANVAATYCNLGHHELYWIELLYRDFEMPC